MTSNLFSPGQRACSVLKWNQDNEGFYSATTGTEATQTKNGTNFEISQ